MPALHGFLEKLHETEGCLGVGRRSGLSKEFWVGFGIV